MLKSVFYIKIIFSSYLILHNSFNNKNITFYNKNEAKELFFKLIHQIIKAMKIPIIILKLYLRTRSFKRTILRVGDLFSRYRFRLASFLNLFSLLILSLSSFQICNCCARLLKNRKK